jgi:hypothetical protein
MNIEKALLEEKYASADAEIKDKTDKLHKV